jgi:RND family efflux transporter MFP subunit
MDALEDKRPTHLLEAKAAGPTNGKPDGHPPHEDGGIPTDLPRISGRALLLAAVVTLALFFILFLVGYLPHLARMRMLAERARADAQQPPLVDVVYPRAMPLIQNVELPGTATPMQQTSIYARVNGYLKRWTADIGDHAARGQVLAEIDAPDVDAQLNSARAGLEVARANVVKAAADLDLAQATYKRYRGLIETAGVTQQQLDQFQSQVNQATAAKAGADASVKSAQANVEQLSATQGFEKIIAPFDGVITARNYDVGALISPANTASGQELFRIAQTDKLRVFVSVPQAYAALVKPGQDVSFTVSNSPNAFHGKMARSAGALDPVTRTLLTELDFDNQDGRLFAGMFGQVNFEIRNDHPTLTIPTSAAMFEDTGSQVAVVADNKIHFTKVTLGRDMGTEIEIIDGLRGGEQIVSTPGERITDGIEVRVVSKKGGM